MKTELLSEIRRSLKRLERQESNLRTWIEGTRGENPPEEEREDRETLATIHGQIEALEAVASWVKRYGGKTL